MATRHTAAIMIKNLPTSAVRFILFIFNATLRKGYYPASWKLSDLVMISKPDKDITQVSSYRPISTINPVSHSHSADESHEGKKKYEYPI